MVDENSNFYQTVQIGSDLELLFIEKDRILIQTIATSNPDQLRSDLEAIGLEDSTQSDFVVSGWLPLESVRELNSIKSLRFASPSYRPIPSVVDTTESSALLPSLNGLENNQGDVAQGSNRAREKFGIDGTGFKVGVLSNSFNATGGYSVDIANGTLPPNIEVLKDDPSAINRQAPDEGRAMLQIVNSVAPGAELAFHTTNFGLFDFANGILELALAGADVIVDDVRYTNEPFFQDGAVAKAINAVSEEKNVAYFSSAGNYADQSYQSTFEPSLTIGNYQFHDFAPDSRSDIFQEITISNELQISFQWDQPFATASSNGKGSESDLDIFLFSEPTFDPEFLVAASVNANIGGDAFECIGFEPTSDEQTYYLAIGQFLPSGGEAPSLIKYIDLAPGNQFEYATNSSTVFGGANSSGGLGVAAANFNQTPAFGVTPPRAESFTSIGVTPILFDTEGNRLASPEIRAQPSITAPDGVSTTVPDFDPFFGTSAAAPYAAGAAALIAEAVPSVTNAQLYKALQASAIDIPPTGFDRITGAGLIQVDKAIDLLLGDFDFPAPTDPPTPGPENPGRPERPGFPGRPERPGFPGTPTSPRRPRVPFSPDSTARTRNSNDEVARRFLIDKTIEANKPPVNQRFENPFASIANGLMQTTTDQTTVDDRSSGGIIGNWLMDSLVPPDTFWL